jgi:hypothetical protein
VRAGSASHGWRGTLPQRAARRSGSPPPITVRAVSVHGLSSSGIAGIHAAAYAAIA